MGQRDYISVVPVTRETKLHAHCEYMGVIKEVPANIKLNQSGNKIHGLRARYRSDHKSGVNMCVHLCEGDSYWRDPEVQADCWRDSHGVQRPADSESVCMWQPETRSTSQSLDRLRLATERIRSVSVCLCLCVLKGTWGYVPAMQVAGPSASNWGDGSSAATAQIECLSLTDGGICLVPMFPLMDLHSDQPQGLTGCGHVLCVFA